MELARAMDPDRQRLFDVGGPRRSRDPVDVAGDHLPGAAARQHPQHRHRVVEGRHELVDSEQRDVDRRQRRRQVGIAFVGHQDDRARLGDGHVRAGDADGRRDELFAQRLSCVELDRFDRRFGAEDRCGVFLRQVDGGGDEVRRMRVRELHHPLPQVCLDDLHAQSFEVAVQPDLLAGHRLALGHDHLRPCRQSAACIPAKLTDDLARLGGVPGEMDRSADGGESFRELLEQLGQAIEVGLAPPLQLLTALREVEVFERLVAAAAQAGHGPDQRFLEAGVV